MEGDAHPDPCLDLRPEIAEERRRAARFAVERRRQHPETPLWLLSLPPPVAMDGDAHLVSFLDLHPELAEERRRARSPDERRFARSADERRRARSADERRRQHNAERRRLRDVGRRWRRYPNSEPSSSRETERSARTQGAGTAISVQQSLLYSNFPMQSGSRRGRERSPSKLPVEEHASEVNSSEGSVTMGLSEFTALALNDMPPKLQSTYWSNVCYDTGSSETESETVVENPEEESDFDLEKELQEMEDYLQENTCNTISEAMDKILAVERSTLAAKYDKMSAAEHADMTARSSYFSKRLPPLWWLSSPADSETQSLQATEQASRNEPSRQCLLRRQPRGEVPDEEIIQNGKNWMTKEVMLAFEEYAERSTNLTGLDWQIEELCNQCFNVEYYHKVFHHYNFTVKIESPKSSDSRVALFFAEVKEIFGRKYYFCCPLEPNENGQCYACNNQGVDDLRHPATGGYDRGSKDIAFPFICMD